MQVKSISQLSPVGNKEGFEEQLGIIKLSASYIEVAVATSEAADAYMSYKFSLKDFVAWILNKIGDTQEGSSAKIESLSTTVDKNFVHKTITGQYSIYANGEMINGPKTFKGNINAPSGNITSLTSDALTATKSNVIELSATNVQSTAINTSQLSSGEKIVTPFLSAVKAETSCLTATYSPAQLTAYAALWS